MTRYLIPSCREVRYTLAIPFQKGTVSTRQPVRQLRRNAGIPPGTRENTYTAAAICAADVIPAPIRKAVSRSAPSAQTLSRIRFREKFSGDGKTLPITNSSTAGGMRKRYAGNKWKIPAEQATAANIRPSIARNKYFISTPQNKQIHYRYYTPRRFPCPGYAGNLKSFKEGVL